MSIEPKLVEGLEEANNAFYLLSPQTPTLRSTILSGGSLKASLGDTNRYLGA